MDLTPGTYVATPYCARADANGSYAVLSFEPQLIQVTGSSPVDVLDLTVAPGTDEATFAGSGCTAGPVDIVVKAISAEDLGSDFDDLFPEDLGDGTGDAFADRAAIAATGLRRQSTRVTGSTGTTTMERVRRSAPTRRAVRADRALSDDGTVQTSIIPDTNGDWSFTDTAGFDNGIVQADATCGVPLGDGFVYNAQIAKVSVPPAPAPGPEPPTPAPTPPAANAVPASPTFTG